ncbi:MAG: hypothetical protein LUD72_03455 [Bacteroidales bacterium]|nr:hypothetical protein [Bacteroidales bacterium]
MRAKFYLGLMAVLVTLPCCEKLDHGSSYDDDEPALPLDDVAALLSELPIGTSQIREVYDAVNSSSYNGYDEEYMMRDLFREPGAGVGDDALSASTLATKAARMEASGLTRADSYETPLRDLIAEQVRVRQTSTKAFTRASGVDVSAEEYLELLEGSDIQIYWPYSEDWDESEYPIITYDPNDGSSANTGYQLMTNEDGDYYVTEVIVNEETAMTHPVWVVNRNDDSSYTSLDLKRMQDPDWGSGGDIVVKSGGGRLSGAVGSAQFSSASGTRADDDYSGLQTLILKDFTAKRNFDSWFGGASEFFVKIGSVDYFTATSEEDMMAYNPSVTEFMIVVKRKQVGETLPFNALLVSDWTEQLESCGFLISEYDGGTRTKWACSAVVKINSKSYGFEIEIPINTKDDIVWSGSLSRRYIVANDGITGTFGDVDLTFEIVEYD